MKRRKFTSALLSLAMAIAMLPMTMLTAHASDQEVLVSLGKSVTLSDSTQNTSSRKAFFTDGIISQQHTWCYTWCKINTTSYAEIDLEDVHSITGASITRQANQGGNHALKVWASETKLNAVPTEATATLLGTTAAGSSGTYTQTVTPAQATEARYIYLTSVAVGSTEGIVEVRVFATPDTEAVNVLAGKTGTPSWGGEMTNWTDGDADELIWGYNNLDWGIPEDSYVLYDLGTPMDLKYFYCSPTRGSDYYLQQSLFVKASNTNDISTATTLIEPFAPTTNRETAPPNGYLKEISGEYQYIWVGASPAYRLCIDDVRVYGYPPEYIVGDWSVTGEDTATITASVPVEYLDGESQTFLMYITNYDAEGNMVGDPTITTIDRADENADDEIETQTMTGTIPTNGSLSIDRTQAVLLDENAKLVSLHNENYGGTWAGFNADKGTASAFQDAVSMSTSAEYPFDDVSMTISGKSVAEDDLIQVMAVVSPEGAAMAADVTETITDCEYLAHAESGNGYEFNIPLNVAGTYTVYVNRIPTEGDIESKTFTYEVIAADDIKAAINAFFPMDTDEDGDIDADDAAPDYATAIDNAVDEVGIIGAVDLIDRDVFYEPDFADVAAQIADIMRVDDEDTGNIALNTSELLDVLNTMTVVYKLSKDEVSVMEEYGDYITENAEVEDWVAENLQYSLTAGVELHDDQWSTVNLTNLGGSGVIKFTFTEEMDDASLTEDNIVITKGVDVINYDIAKATKDEFWVDLGSLASNGEYVITFGNNCKTLDNKLMLNAATFDFTTGTIVDLPYVEGKMIKDISTDKTIVNADDVTLTSEGDEQPIESIIDGTTSSGFTGFKSAPIIDLGAYYSPAAVKIVGRMDNCPWHFDQISFIGAAEAVAYEEDGVTPTDASFDTGTGAGVTFHYSGDQTTADSQESKVIAATGASALNAYGPVRYVKVSKSGAAYMKEITIYAYVDIEAGPISVNEDEISSGSTHTFSATTINNNVTDAAPYMLAFAYDENGFVVAKDIVAMTNPTTTATVTATAETVGITAMLVEDLSTMTLLCNPMTIGTELTATASAMAGAYIDGDIDRITVGVGTNTDITAKASATALIIKEDAGLGITGTPAEVFANLSAADLESAALAFATATKVGTGFAYELTGFDEGEKYFVQIAATSADKTKRSVAQHKQAILSAAERDEIIASVMDSTGEDLADAIIDAVFVEEAVAQNLINDVDSLATMLDDARFVEILGYTKDMMAADEAFTESLPAIADIINAAQAVYAVDAEDEEEATELLAAYGDLLGDAYTAEANVATMIEIFADHNTFTSGTTMADAINWSAHLSILDGATTEDKAEAFETYEDQYGIDLDYASDRKISLTRAAKYFDTTDLEAIYGATKFNEAFEAAVQKAKSAAAEVTGSKTQTGKFGNLTDGSAERGVEDDEPTATPKPVATTQPAKSGFGDMANYAWADEAVAKLVEAGVVNGNEKGEFEPARNVTRGEFVKMLIVASKIKVDEGTSIHFVDVPDSSWQHPYVQIAYSRGICRGVDDYTFNVNGAITRQDMAVMITNLLNYMSVNTSGDAIDFTDAQAIADYAVSAVDTASMAGLINGFDDGSFRPRDNTRRVDAAMVISRLMEKIN